MKLAVTGVGWITGAVVCVGLSCAPLQVDEGAPVARPCETYTTCGACTAANACGWCNDRCTSGTRSGSTVIQCTDRWRWLMADCVASGGCTAVGNSCVGDMECCF